MVFPTSNPFLSKKRINSFHPPVSALEKLFNFSTIDQLAKIYKASFGMKVASKTNVFFSLFSLKYYEKKLDNFKVKHSKTFSVFDGALGDLSNRNYINLDMSAFSRDSNHEINAFTIKQHHQCGTFI